MKLGDRRAYRMVARAEAVATTADRILDSAVSVFWDSPAFEVSLDEVARRAGVTVQTVIRRFGSRDGLLAAAAARESGRVRTERSVAPGATAADAVRVLVDHYERTGDRVLKMLAEEQRLPSLSAVVKHGRDLHREWCAEVFAASLAGLSGVDADRRLAQLIAVCDVYTWKLLRHDAGLSREQTELALLELLNPLLKESS